MRREWSRSPRLEMMPLIDVVFLLLVVFIFSMLTMVRSYVIPVDLPEMSTGEVHDLSSVLVVSVAKDGSISIGGQELEASAVLSELEERRRADPKMQILINADRDARHGDVAEILDLIRAAGERRVMLVAQEEDEDRSF